MFVIDITIFLNHSKWLLVICIAKSYVFKILQNLQVFFCINTTTTKGQCLPINIENSYERQFQ